MNQNMNSQINFYSSLRLCVGVARLRHRLGQIIQKLTPEVVNSLTGWDFITTAVLRSSS